MEPTFINLTGRHFDSEKYNFDGCEAVINADAEELASCQELYSLNTPPSSINIAWRVDQLVVIALELASAYRTPFVWIDPPNFMAAALEQGLRDNGLHPVYAAFDYSRGPGKAKLYFF
jgi:hypothetical protein